MDNKLEKRIVIVEEEIELLKKRPSNAVDLDWETIASKQDLLDLTEKVKILET